MKTLHRHDVGRTLTRTERKTVATAFGWTEIESVGRILIGKRPLYDSVGRHYGWLVDQPVPQYDYDTLRFVRKIL